MKRRIFILPILGATLLAGCMHEQPAAPVPEALQQKSIYDQEDLAVIRAIEQLDREAEGVLAKSAAVVELPDGSVDALAAAIAAAGPGGVVRVLSGEHRESGTVTITHAVKILGEAGANLVFDSKPTTVAGAIDPALHILNAPEVMIHRLKIRAQEDVGGTGILIEDSPHAMIGRNEIIDYQFSIMLEDGDHARIWKNTISATPAWLTTFFAVHGVVVINGNKVRMVGNDVTNAFFGV
jgi:nitrous oxidase accessory protein NosD